MCAVEGQNFFVGQHRTGGKHAYLIKMVIDRDRWSTAPNGGFEFKKRKVKDDLWLDWEGI